MSQHISENRPPIARFGGPRHKAIADIADEHLTDGARLKIQAILQKIDKHNLQDVAT